MWWALQLLQLYIKSKQNPGIDTLRLHPVVHDEGFSQVLRV